jgi:hypothetical protein
MVKKIVLSTLFPSLTSVFFLAAGEFTANVSNTQVHLSESFTLNLTLKDVSPKEAPAISTLKKDFSIHSQQHSTQTTIVNGKTSTNITWHLSLTPTMEGVIQIPPITVDTAEGLLSTQPITLNVIKAATPQSSADSTGPHIITKVSNASPYKNEPILYTVLLSSKTPLYHVQAQKMQVEDAIVELVEEPKLAERPIEGVLHHVLEFTYLITPLKTGPLKIPSMAIQGAIPQKRTGQYRSFFNDDLDPFTLLQGFERLKPFALTAEESALDVQPSISEISPWLPAKALDLEEQWSNDQTLRVGEPFSRSFLIKAEGCKASQLPHLEDLQNQNGTFKVYADKPEEEEKVFQGALQSMRKEQYTLIPQQAGACVLPEISISWWDSAKKEKRTSTILARTVHILPALETAASASQENTSPVATEAAISSVRPPFVLYGIIGILTFFLTAALLWGCTLQRKITSLTKGPAQKPLTPPPAKPQKKLSPLVIQKEKKEKLPDLNPT